MSYTLKFFCVCSIYVCSCSTPSFSSPANSSHPIQVHPYLVSRPSHPFKTASDGGLTAFGGVRWTVASLDARSGRAVQISGQGGVDAGATAWRRTRTVLATSITHHRCTITNDHTPCTISRYRNTVGRGLHGPKFLRLAALPVCSKKIFRPGLP